ncbi:putative X protein [Wuhan House Fly Virus 1]|uniref:Putative X protein n=1 Tax=Wuhan House Fly Virus 1 TaxID=1608104 RepID=A0A0B5KK77_9RHAB|nr:putative X protein [Wuhan House Fly Virus 1]AJG39165.1 putative X protein [Wuhan House Fly Virus 1]
MKKTTKIHSTSSISIAETTDMKRIALLILHLFSGCCVSVVLKIPCSVSEETLSAYNTVVTEFQGTVNLSDPFSISQKVVLEFTNGSKTYLYTQVCETDSSEIQISHFIDTDTASNIYNKLVHKAPIVNPDNHYKPLPDLQVSQTDATTSTTTTPDPRYALGIHLSDEWDNAVEPHVTTTPSALQNVSIKVSNTFTRHSMGRELERDLRNLSPNFYDDEDEIPIAYQPKGSYFYNVQDSIRRFTRSTSESNKNLDQVSKNLLRYSTAKQILAKRLFKMEKQEEQLITLFYASMLMAVRSPPHRCVNIMVYTQVVECYAEILSRPNGRRSHNRLLRYIFIEINVLQGRIASETELYDRYLWRINKTSQLA